MVILPAQYTSSRRVTSSSSTARTNSTTLSGPAGSPIRRNTRPKVTAASSIGGGAVSGGIAAPRQQAEGHAHRALLVLAVLENRAQGGGEQVLVQLPGPEGHERLGPVQRLGDAGGLVEVHVSEVLDGLGHLARQLLLGPRHPEAHYLHLPLQAGVVYVEVEAAPLQGVVDLAGPVGGQDGHRRTVGPYGSKLRDGDGELGEDLQQKGLELVVGPIYLVDEQHRRHGPLVLQRREQRPADQKLPGVELVLEAGPVFGRSQGLGGADVQELPGVVPLVDRLVHVDALVALEPDKGRVQHARQHLRHLRLADPGLALQKERAAQLEGEKDGGGKPLAGQVVALPEPCGELRRTRNAGGQGPPAAVRCVVQRDRASSTARLVHTLAKWRRKSAEAAPSEVGSVPSSAAWAASATPSGEAPERASSTALALMGVEPMLVSPIRAESMVPLLFSTTAATPTMAQSCDRRLNFL